MVRDGGGGDTAPGNNLAAGHLSTRGDGLENHQARWIGKSFRNLHKSRQLHVTRQFNKTHRGELKRRHAFRQAMQPII